MICRSCTHEYFIPIVTEIAIEISNVPTTIKAEISICNFCGEMQLTEEQELNIVLASEVRYDPDIFDDKDIIDRSTNQDGVNY